MEKFTNGLSDAELERLALLSEELGEAQQAIGKIIRHGYTSFNPLVPEGLNNRGNLEREIGDICAALTLLWQADDIDDERISRREKRKYKASSSGCTTSEVYHHQLRSLGIAVLEPANAPAGGSRWIFVLGRTQAG